MGNNQLKCEIIVSYQIGKQDLNILNFQLCIARKLANENFIFFTINSEEKKLTIVSDFVMKLYESMESCCHAGDTAPGITQDDGTRESIPGLELGGYRWDQVGSRYGEKGKYMLKMIT